MVSVIAQCTNSQLSYFNSWFWLHITVGDDVYISVCSNKMLVMTLNISVCSDKVLVMTLTSMCVQTRCW